MDVDFERDEFLRGLVVTLNGASCWLLAVIAAAYISGSALPWPSVGEFGGNALAYTREWVIDPKLGLVQIVAYGGIVLTFVGPTWYWVRPVVSRSVRFRLQGLRYRMRRTVDVNWVRDREQNVGVPDVNRLRELRNIDGPGRMSEIEFHREGKYLAWPGLSYYIERVPSPDIDLDGIGLSPSPDRAVVYLVLGGSIAVSTTILALSILGFVGKPPLTQTRSLAVVGGGYGTVAMILSSLWIESTGDVSLISSEVWTRLAVGDPHWGRLYAVLLHGTFGLVCSLVFAVLFVPASLSGPNAVVTPLGGVAAGIAYASGLFALRAGIRRHLGSNCTESATDALPLLLVHFLYGAVLGVFVGFAPQLLG